LAFDVGAVLPVPRAKNRLAERICTEQDILTMIVTEQNPRNALLLRLLYVSAARISEVASLRWRDLQSRFEGGQVSFFGKGGKTRAVRLPAQIWQDLEVVRQGDNEFVFPSKRKIASSLTTVQLWRIVKQAAKRAGLKGDISPHWFRHAHASHALERGANVKVVQETLGHDNLQTTSLYTHARPEDSSALYLIIQ
jgi:integrase/recombinase XerD